MWEQVSPEPASQVELHTQTKSRRKTLLNLQFLTGANVVSSVELDHPYWKAKNLNARVIPERPTLSFGGLVVLKWEWDTKLRRHR